MESGKGIIYSSGARLKERWTENISQSGQHDLSGFHFFILLLLESFPSQVDIFLNTNDIFLSYKLLFSTPK